MEQIFQFILPSAFVAVGFLLAVLAIAHMLTQRRSPRSALAWLLIIVLLPWIGVPLYLMFSGRKMSALARSKSAIHMTTRRALSRDQLGIDGILQTYGLPGASDGHRFALNHDGVAGYRSLLEVIDSAEVSLRHTTYILGDDPVGRDIVKRMARKAADGVDVRLLLDGVGSLNLGSDVTSPLIEAGGQVATFMPVWRRPLRGRTNLRNHRKMMIADGQLVWSGGCNTAIEYIGPEFLPDRRLDLSFRLEGPAVQGFAEIFASDWAFATRSVPEPVDLVAGAPDEGQVLQIVPSGPDVHENPLFDSLINGFYRAQNRIWITTPYFVPPDTITQALSLAARRGVDTCVLLPKRSDHRLTDLARASHLREMEDAGCRILLCDGPMLHAKAIVIDNAFASIGTANMDERSFFVNYEIMVYLYGGDGIGQICDWFTTRMVQAQEGMGGTPNQVRVLLEGVARLTSPLL